MIDDLIKRWVRADIRALGAYHVADSQGFIKLDAMENPYTWSDELRQAWLDELKATDVNRYPDPSGEALKKQLYTSMNIPSDMALLLGNGSDEIIQMIMIALQGDGRKILSIEPAFVMYKMIATFCKMPYISVPLKADDFGLDFDLLIDTIKKEQPAVIFLAYPNNPTANLFDRKMLDQIIQTSQGLVVIDEAYAPFANASYMDQLGKYDNLVVMRTVSKMGLAGLRLGLLAGPTAWLNEFDKVRLPYNINVLTQISTRFALQHQAVFDQQTTQIIKSREALIQQLQTIPRFKVYPSNANFVLVRTAPSQAKRIFNELKQRGILIKILDSSHPLLHDCLRLTVGTEVENKQLMEALISVV